MSSNKIEKHEFDDDFIETDSYQSIDEPGFRLPKLQDSKTFRNAFIVFPFAVIVCVMVYASFAKTSQSLINISSSIATVPTGKVYGVNFLYDLTTDQGAIENDNVYDNTAYAGKLKTMQDSVAKWIKLVGTPDIPSVEGERDTWSTNGGVTPWLMDTAQATVIPSLYSYSGAPHIVFLLVDDWGYNDAGYQSTYMPWATPNIDKLASSGVKLTNYFTNNLCAPSRASLMTGRYALRFGMHGAPDDAELPLGEVTLAEELKTAGYRTNLVGKWHLGWSSLERTPNKRGFDYVYGYLSGHIDYWTKYFMADNLDLNENGRIVTVERELAANLHTGYLFQEKVEAVISDHATNHKSEPMFLYYASQLLHSDWAAPKQFLSQCTASDEATAIDQTTLVYCAMNLMLDEVVGNLTCSLERNGMADNTVIIVASDNGGYAAMAGSSAPYRGSKGSLTRGGDSVPAFIYAPNTLMPISAKGTSYDGQMHVTDWLPTIMGLATGGAWTGSFQGNELDGVDMWNAVTTNTASPRHEIVHYLTEDGNCSYQYDMMKLIITKAGFIDSYSLPNFEFLGHNELSECLV